MPRRPRLCLPGVPVHVIRRGNNKQVCFSCDEDIKSYVHWLREGASKDKVSIHAWVFMTNHIHLLMTPTGHNDISRLMQFVGRQYVQRFNFRYARSGTLFEGRFRSCLVQNNDYPLTCTRYIELNPVRAAMVADPGDHQWSSYRCHAFGLTSQLLSPHRQYLALGKHPKERQANYRCLIGDNISDEVITKVRHCSNTGIVIGTKDFREQVGKMRS